MKLNFQTIILIVFLVAFGIAVIAFSGILSSGSSSTTTPKIGGEVVVWGVLPDEQIQSYISNFNINTSAGYTLVYNEHSPEKIYQDVVTALSEGVQPDMVIISSELLSQFKSKLYITSYQVYNERTFRDTHIDGAQIFLDKDGISAFPLFVDPLVTYYNKDILAGQNFVTPPTTWTGLQNSIRFFTKRDGKNSIFQTTLALGTDQNINHLSDIIAALFLQTGNPIISSQNKASISEAPTASDAPPTVQALSFYTSFANPTSSNYSWNSGLPSSLQMFLAGKSAFYIGRSSELFTIQQQNPNLNFDVIELFQPEGSVRPVTFGSFTAIGVLKNAPNIITAYPAATAFASKENIDNLSKTLALPPARRDLLFVSQTNPYVSIFFKAALSAFTWPNPNSASTDKVFRDMIQSVNSGATDIQTAITNANRDLQSTIR